METSPNISETNTPVPRAGVFRRIVRAIGPGFITGAADDDPSGIATYSQTGAMFGFRQLWLTPFSYPFMVAVQEMCGRIGLVTGAGLATVLRRHYARPILLGSVALLLVANTINIGADLSAMVAAIKLVLPVAYLPTLVLLSLGMLVLQVVVPYERYVGILKYLTLSLLSYIVVAFVVVADWGSVFVAMVHPHVAWSQDLIFNVAAFLGTTISPYLFFWQADEEAEEEVAAAKIPEMGEGAPLFAEEDMSRMRRDTFLGMLFSQLVTFFVIVSVATTIGAHGMTTIATAADAALALRPIAGDFAFALFALGIIGTGLLAIPVLAGSVGYAVAEVFGWKEGLGKRFRDARGFYAVIGLVIAAGTLIAGSGIDPMQTLYWSAIVNGVLAAPLIFVLLFVANDTKIMGKWKNGKLSNILGTIIAVLMTGVAIATIWSL